MFYLFKNVQHPVVIFSDRKITSFCFVLRTKCVFFHKNLCVHGLCWCRMQRHEESRQSWKTRFCWFKCISLKTDLKFGWICHQIAPGLAAIPKKNKKQCILLTLYIELTFVALTFIPVMFSPKCDRVLKEKCYRIFVCLFVYTFL